MLLQNIQVLIRSHRLITSGDDVLLGVSGGPDSMCLLWILWRLHKTHGFSLQVAHVHHGLRGEEADADEALVRDWCGRRGIDCFVSRVNIRQLTARRKRSLEDVSRQERLAFFKRCCRRLNKPKVVLAHTADDQAETVLLRLVRGTGITGLCAMRVLSLYEGLAIVRPLLRTTKDEVMRFLKVKKIPFRLDESNAQPIYTRNRVRLEVMPLLEALNPRAKAHLARLAEHAQQAEAVLAQRSRQMFQRLFHQDGGRLWFARERLRRLTPDMCRRVMGMAIRRVYGPGHGIDARHSDRLQHFLAPAATRRQSVLMLPRGVRIRSQGADIILSQSAGARRQRMPAATLSPAKPCVLPAWGCVFSLRVAPRPGRWGRGSGRVEYLDYDRLRLPLRIRTRRPGDVFWPLGAPGKKKLSDFFIDQKIDAAERDRVLLLVSGRKIVWVVGQRLSDTVKITARTRRVVRVEVGQMNARAAKDAIIPASGMLR